MSAKELLYTDIPEGQNKVALGTAVRWQCKAVPALPMAHSPCSAGSLMH